MRHLFSRLGQAIYVMLQASVLLWTTLALYFANLPSARVRIAIAIGFAIFGIWALWFSSQRGMRWLLVGTVVGVACWFLSLAPSHDRPWRAEVAVLPRAIVDGDKVRFTGFRNFDYTSRDEFTPHFEEREVAISDLQGLDLIISYWKPGPVAHTFVTFRFKHAKPICISIETRPEKGEGFAPIASLFKQFELIYVVGDERDLVGVRANHRQEEVLLYPIQVSPEAVRRLFRVYISRINELADRAEWYHLLSNNCTLNIVRYANAAGRMGRFDFRHLLNGYFDRYLFQAGLIETDLPFEENRARARINEAARKAEGAIDFSQLIRESQESVVPEKGQN